MKILFPAYAGFAFMLLAVQTYLLFYVALILLRRMKILQRPYSGMDYPESLFGAILLLGILSISSANASGLFQAAKVYDDSHASIRELSFLFFIRSFLVVLFFSLLYVVLNYVNVRLLFRGFLQAPVLTVSILLCAISMGLALLCWITCREIIDNMTPKIVNFQ